MSELKSLNISMEVLHEKTYKSQSNHYTQIYYFCSGCNQTRVKIIFTNFKFMIPVKFSSSQAQLPQLNFPPNK